MTEATEISPQGGAEAVAEVRALNAALERRTAELEVALSNLQAQNSQRTQAEAALRESEQRYRRLVELSPEAILVIADEALVYVNAAGLRLFRAADATEMRDRPLRDLIHTEDVKRVLAGLRRLLSSGSDVAAAELRLRRIDNSALEAEISAAGVTFDGRPAVQVLVRDVGERRQMERMKDELLSIVSHELRTPLTSLRGSLGLLAGGLLGGLPARGQRMLDIAVSNSDRLIYRLLNDVLDLERMRSGRLTLSAHRVRCHGSRRAGACGDARPGCALESHALGGPRGRHRARPPRVVEVEDPADQLAGGVQPGDRLALGVDAPARRCRSAAPPNVKVMPHVTA